MPPLRVFILVGFIDLLHILGVVSGWDTTQNSKMFEKERGGHRTFLLRIFGQMFKLRVGGRLSNLILDPTLALIRAKLGFRIQVGAECSNDLCALKQILCDKRPLTLVRGAFKV